MPSKIRVKKTKDDVNECPEKLNYEYMSVFLVPWKPDVCARLSRMRLIMLEAGAQLILLKIKEETVPNSRQDIY